MEEKEKLLWKNTKLPDFLEKDFTALLDDEIMRIMNSQYDVIVITKRSYEILSLKEKAFNNLPN